MTTTTVKPFPKLELEGPPRKVGFDHGRLLGDRIAVSIDHYRTSFEKQAGLEWSTALVLASALTPTLRERAPDLVEEMEGIAQGSENPLEVIVALNARTGLLRTTPAAVENAEAECTTGAALPAKTKDGHTILFGNWDQNVRCLENSAVLEVRVPDRLPVLFLTEAGILMRTGFNSAGIGITGNSLASELDGTVAGGIPWPIVRRQVLQQDRISEALKVVFESPRAHSGNHVVADAEGFAVDLEATPGEVFTITPEDDLVFHSNHFISPGACARVSDRQVGRSPSTLYRVSRLAEGVKAAGDQVTIETIQNALRDHFGHPDSVCAHPTEDRRSTTVASHISDLAARTLFISSGPPCENPYQRYQLN